MRKILTIIVLLMLCLFGVSAKIDSLEVSKVSNRLKNLEDYKVNIDNLYKAESEKLKNENNKGMLIYSIIPLLIGGIIGGSLSAKLIKDSIQKRADKLFEEKIKGILEGNNNNLLQLLNNYNEDSQIKLKTKLLILSSSKESYLKESLNKQGFKFEEIQVNTLETSFSGSIDKFDLVVINNEADKMKTISLLETFEYIKNANKFCFYYGPNIKELNNEEYLDVKNKMSSSNFRTQVIGNIMNLLKYN